MEQQTNVPLFLSLSLSLKSVSENVKGGWGQESFIVLVSLVQLLLLSPGLLHLFSHRLPHPLTSGLSTGTVREQEREESRHAPEHALPQDLKVCSPPPPGLCFRPGVCRARQNTAQWRQQSIQKDGPDAL